MIRKSFASAVAAAALLVVSGNLAAQSMQSPAEAKQAVASLKPQHGVITLPEAKVSLDIGNNYDFYGPNDARTILVGLWGNPPQSVEGVLGMVMKAGKSPLEDNWGAVITYEPSGYVSDDDAADTDYAAILKQMQDGEADVNAERQKNGYPAIHLVGWAEQPAYNKNTHSVVWAQDVKFAGAESDTLNYDLRSLGRNGVLSVNMVSSMPHLAEIKVAANEFASHVKFDAGARYEDFDPASDKKAEYGVGGLVAAGVGVAVAKKLGLFAILLKFIKPILIGIVALGAVMKNRILGFFGRGRDPLEGQD